MELDATPAIETPLQIGWIRAALFGAAAETTPHPSQIQQTPRIPCYTVLPSKNRKPEGFVPHTLLYPKLSANAYRTSVPS